METSKPKPWKLRLAELVLWVWTHMVNRTDVWGGFYFNDGELVRTTHPAKVKRQKIFLAQEIIRSHFENADQIENIIGLHVTSPQNTCRFFVVDIDKHNDSADAEANWRAVQAWYEKLRSLGHYSLLIDSNGNGGYHLYDFFSEAIPAADCWEYGHALVADYRLYGLKEAPEVFPKQPYLTESGAGSIGNWLRLFGKHPKRDHYARIWDGEKWLEGDDCPPFILNLKLSDPGTVPIASKSKEPRVLKSTPPAPSVDLNQEEIERLILKKVERTSHRVAGSGRSDEAFKLAAYIIKDLKQSEETALTYVASWNQKNEPPLDLETLRSTIANAAQYGHNETGSCPDAQYVNLVKKIKSKPQQDTNAPTEPVGDGAISADHMLKLLKSGQDSYDILVEFLRTFHPVYRTSKDKIGFKNGVELTPSQCSGLRGGLPFLRRLPEYAEQKTSNGVRPTTEHNLASTMFGIAGRRLMAELPEQDAHSGSSHDEIQDALVGFLLSSHTFYGDSGVPVSQSYASWLSLLAPDAVWVQCYKHSIFGHASAGGDCRLAVVPEFLFTKVPRLQRAGKNTDAAGQLLLAMNFIVRQSEGKGSYQIRTNNRRVRTWELAPSIINLACGETENKPKGGAE